jgi:hypothetical protein
MTALRERLQSQIMAQIQERRNEKQNALQRGFKPYYSACVMLEGDEAGSPSLGWSARTK